MFQDEYADMKLKNFGTLRAGRFVPDFLLQRNQPDYEIPVLERALAVNGLIHNPLSTARETGVAYLFNMPDQPWHFSLGIFNGNVDQFDHNRNHSLLYPSRVNRNIPLTNQAGFTAGGSLSYRYLNEMQLVTIYPADSLITGNDFRWGVEIQAHWNHTQLQSEYISAIIDAKKADGYYVPGAYTLPLLFRLSILSFMSEAKKVIVGTEKLLVCLYAGIGIVLRLHG